MDDDQREYMLNTKLMRNDIEYDITANDIGLDKIRLENYATWKTKGTLYTQRYDKDNNRWAANFMVMPMAADAELEGFAEFKDGNVYYLGEHENMAFIPIFYGAQMINLSDYAKAEHVKEIKSQIYVNDLLIDEVVGTEKTKIDKNIGYKVHKIENQDELVLNIKVKSSLITKFTTDGVLTDVKNYTIVVYFDNLEDEELKKDESLNEDESTENKKGEKEGDEEEDEDKEENKLDINKVWDDNYIEFPDFPPPHVSEITITQGNGKNLYRLKNGKSEFVCAGQTITIKAVVVNAPATVTIEFEGDKSIFTFDELTKKFEWDEPKERKVKTNLSSLDAYKKMYSGKVIMKEEKRIDETSIQYTYTYIIPYGTRQTLNSWATLRNTSKDAFNIDEKKLFTRIMSPYQVVVKATNIIGADTKRYYLDVFERWDTIYNRDISKYIS